MSAVAAARGAASRGSRSAGVAGRFSVNDTRGARPVSSQGLIGRCSADDDELERPPMRPRTSTPTTSSRTRGAASPSFRRPSDSPPINGSGQRLASRSPSETGSQSPPRARVDAGNQRQNAVVPMTESQEDPEDIGVFISTDTFSNITSHIMSIQSLLNKQHDHAKRARHLQRYQVEDLQKENQQLKGRLDSVVAACLPVKAILMPGSEESSEDRSRSPLGGHRPRPSPSPAGGLQGETGGSASGTADDIEAIPKPPAPLNAAVPDYDPPNMKSPAPSPLPPVGCLPPGFIMSPRQPLESGLEGAMCGVVPSSSHPKAVKEEPIREFKASETAAEEDAASTKKIVTMKSALSCESVESYADYNDNNVADDTFFRMGEETSTKVHVGTPVEPETTGRRKSELGISSVGTAMLFGVEDDDKTQGPPKAVFADAAAMKEKIRQAIGKHEYNVADFYWETGIAQAIATNNRFDQFTLFIIAFNAIWIAVDADLNDAAVLSEAKPEFQFAENFFCAFFTFEWCVRFMAFQNKRDCLRDSWFVFDSLLVIFMVGETWVLSFIFASGASLGDTSSLRLLRLLRLTRMARMARLLRAMPELMILIKGMAVAMRSVFFTLCLLGVIIYLFSIAFRQLTDGTEVGDRYFSSVPAAMSSLLLRGTLPDQADIVYEVSVENPLLGICILMFILFASLTVMNMLVGVLCEVVSVVSSVEKEQLVVNFVGEQLRALITHLLGDAERPMSKVEFSNLLGHEQAAKCLHEVGVDVLGLMEITDFLFKDEEKHGRGLAFQDFMEMVLELRGSNTATVKHIVDLQRFVHLELKKTRSDMERHILETIGAGQSHFDDGDDPSDAKRASLDSMGSEPPKSGHVIGFGHGGMAKTSSNMARTRTKVIKR